MPLAQGELQGLPLIVEREPEGGGGMSTWQLTEVAPSRRVTATRTGRLPDKIASVGARSGSELVIPGERADHRNSRGPATDDPPASRTMRPPSHGFGIILSHSRAPWTA